MSLINEALKKAQRQRSGETPDPSGAAPAGALPPIRRGKRDNASTMVLLGSGALVLVVLSVVFTVFLVNRPLKPSAAIGSNAPVEARTPAAPVIAENAAPAIVAPMITVPASTATTETAASSPVAAIASAPFPSTPPAPTAEPIAKTPVLAEEQSVPAAASQPLAPAIAAPQTPPPSPTLAPDAPDERIAAFVEAIRVTGIRSSGAESRVLMNERVYRVNDIVERVLNVRLVKAEADTLTFADPRGVLYEKRF